MLTRLAINRKGEQLMKKNYETPELLLTLAEDSDVISTSAGDTPVIDLFEW
jgi:hypothetical protein